MAGNSDLWRLDEPLVLASKSAIRRQLLEAAGIPVVAEPARVDERALEAGMPEGTDPGELAARLARAKALEASARHPRALCLGADQVLFLGAQVLHKAGSLEDARAKLSQLAGRSHALTSAFALARGGESLREGRETAVLTMRPLDPAQIDLYLGLAGSAVLSSVGGYQLETLGAHLFDRIEGDHTTILGLPLLPVLAALRQEGALAL